MYILPWSFPILFASARDPKLVRGEDPFDHPRIHFKLDDAHPQGGSTGQTYREFFDLIGTGRAFNLLDGSDDGPLFDENTLGTRLRSQRPSLPMPEWMLYVRTLSCLVIRGLSMAGRAAAFSVPGSAFAFASTAGAPYNPVVE